MRHISGAKFRLFHGAALRSARVKWLLHELLGDEFEVQSIDTYEAEQYRPEYLAINPNHAVPTLQIVWPDGETINMIESAAMIALLADTFPEAGLAPASQRLTRDRADYLQVLHFGATIDWMLWQIRLHAHVLPDLEKDTRAVRRYERKFADEVEPQLMQRLMKANYVCGKSFSAADCVIAHGVAWARAYGLCGQHQFADYLATMATRPAYQRAFADAGSFVLEVPRDKPVVNLVTG